MASKRLFYSGLVAVVSDEGSLLSDKLFGADASDRGTDWACDASPAMWLSSAVGPNMT